MKKKTIKYEKIKLNKEKNITIKQRVWPKEQKRQASATIKIKLNFSN